MKETYCKYCLEVEHILTKECKSVVRLTAKQALELCNRKLENKLNYFDELAIKDIIRDLKKVIQSSNDYKEM